MKPAAVRFLILGLAALALAWLVARHAEQVEALAVTLRHGRPGWVALAVLLQAATLLNQPALYQSLYAMLGLPARWRDLAPLVWAGHFANAATPSAGLGGTALLLDDARRRGWNAARAALASTLYFAFNFAVFALVLLAALASLLSRGGLSRAEAAASAILLAILILAALALALLAARPRVFERAASRLAALASRIARREVVAPEKVSGFVREFALGLGAAREPKSRAHLARAGAHALLVDGLEIAVLGACFGAFAGGESVGWGVMLVGYAIGTLFLVVSVTPQGLGVVEGAMAAVFASLGVPAERAAAVVLAYRGLSFWLPLLVGFCALRWTPRMQHPTPQGHPKP